MNSKDRYRRRRELIGIIRERGDEAWASIDKDGVSPPLIVDHRYANEVLSRNRAFYHFDPNVVVTDAEAKEFLRQFKDNYNRQCFENMINQCKKEITSKIVKTLGLGQVTAAYDGISGNKDTVRTDKEEQRHGDIGQKEGSSTGLRQAIGNIIAEFFSLLFNEAFDIYDKGFRTSGDDQSFLNALRTRIERIGTKLKDRWKDLADRVKLSITFDTISGCVSELVKAVVNMFSKTGKLIAKAVWGGIFSLFKAVKLLIFPPKGMTFGDALDEAKKLVVTGIIVAAGVTLEGAITLGTFGTIDLSSILFGSLTSFVVALAVYHIDKRKNDKKAMQEMIKQAHEGYDRIIALLDSRL